MSQNEWGNEGFGGGWQNFDQSNPNSNFADQNFQRFDYSYPNAPTSQSYSNQASYMVPAPSIMTPEDNAFAGPSAPSIDDEPPLLEELGIDPDAILQKTLNVLNPLRHTHPSIIQDQDFAGPLVFCLAFGSLLLLSGKVHFGYIYGIGLLGCVSLYSLLNMMSVQGASFGVVVSVLGYCILPMVGLAALNIIIRLQDLLGIILAGTAIMWCSWSASKLFVTAFDMHHQQPLIAYPCALFYAVFALITVF